VPQLDIQLLGHFNLSLDGRPLTKVNTSRLQTLLAYLLLKCQEPQRRQHIAFLFWPDTSEGQALTNLRSLLSRLRRNLAEADLFLRADRHTLQWLPDAPFTLDVTEFEEACATAQTAVEWQRAVDLYQGPLMPGYYDEWLASERERLQQCFLRAGSTLLDLQENERHYASAVQTAQQLLRYDPLHEATYRSLMRSHAQNGAKADALRAYHKCVTLLQEELGVAPEQATRHLYEHLFRAEPDRLLEPEPEPDMGVTPLVGRNDELEALKRAWRTAVSGRATMVLISGEAGVGKSRLAAELLQWVRRQGVLTVTTRSYEAEGELAFGPLLAWLRAPVLQSAWRKLPEATLTELARLLPELLVDRLDLPAPAPALQSWQRQRLFEALAQAILARSRPLLLHIDDLQWSDRESLEWLHFLLRYAPRAPVLVAAAYRPEELSEGHPLVTLQRALQRSRQLKLVGLQRLAEADTASLARHLVGRPLEAAERERIYRETEGNPLFVIEMIRGGLPGQGSLPPTIQAMIQARFSRLSAQARELVGQAAVIGRAFEYDLLAAISGMNEKRLVAALDELWHRRIIREHGGAEYDFSHDKLREVAYSDLSQARRRLLHRHVAQALEMLHASQIETYSGKIAAHYERAQMPREAIPHYHRAAQAAQQLHAHDEAIQHLRRGLDLLAALPVGAPVSWWQTMEGELQESLGDLLHFTAHYEAAQAAYEAALRALSARGEPLPVTGCRLWRKAGSACLAQHHYEEALHSFDRAQGCLGEKTEAHGVSWWREWIELQRERKYVYYWLNRSADIANILAESQPVLVQYGTPEQRARFFDPSLFLRRDRFAVSEEVLAHTRQWFAANLDTGNPDHIPSLHFMMGFVLLWYGALGEAEAEMRAALAMTVETGDVNLRARCLTYLAVLCRKQERVAEVAELAAESVSAAEEAGMHEYVATARANQAWLAWRAGDYRRAEVHGRDALALWKRLPAGHASCAFQWTALLPLLALALPNGRLDEAVAWAQALLDPAQQRLPGELAARLQQAVGYHETERPAEAGELLSQAVALAQQLHLL
jgi:DNA-binding SARP family transcriptional activator